MLEKGVKKLETKNHEMILTLQNSVKIQRSSFEKYKNPDPCLPQFIAVSSKLEFQFLKRIKSAIGKQNFE